MLEISDAAVSYGGITAVRSVSVVVRPQHVVALVGRNGAGKSSLLRAVAGLTPMKSGSVTIDGVTATNLPAHRYARLGLGLVPEERTVFVGLSIEESLLVGSPRSKSLTAERLDVVYGIFPVLADRRRQSCAVLSGGQQQMLGIGRALMAGPTYLLLDEPTLGLAPVVITEVFEAIQGLVDLGTGILLVEQNAHLACQLADEVLLMDRGSVTYKASGADVEVDALAEMYL